MIETNILSGSTLILFPDQLFYKYIDKIKQFKSVVICVDNLAVGKTSAIGAMRFSKIKLCYMMACVFKFESYLKTKGVDCSLLELYKMKSNANQNNSLKSIKSKFCFEPNDHYRMR